MLCPKCSAELPAQAVFCMKCGAAIAASPRGSATPPTPRWRPVAAAAGALLLVGLAILGARAISGRLTNRDSRTGATAPLADRSGGVGNVGPLVDRSGGVGSGPLVDRSASVAQPATLPADVIDYLRFLKEIETRRVLLQKKQVGELLKQSGDLTYAGATEDWTTDAPERKQAEIYQNFQRSLAQWDTDWQELGAALLMRNPPAACVALRDRYMELVGKTSGVMNRAGSQIATGFGEDRKGAVEALTQMRGSGLGTPSKEIADACQAADEELLRVCKQSGISKDFDIQDESGGGSLLGR